MKFIAIPYECYKPGMYSTHLSNNYGMLNIHWALC